MKVSIFLVGGTFNDDGETFKLYLKYVGRKFPES